MAKDFTKYTLEGIANNLNKARLVQRVIESYCENNELNYTSLKSIWPDDLQGGKGVVRLHSEIDVPNERNYYMDSPITLSDGSKVVVCNQWGKGNISNFINCAVNAGFKIKEEEEENTENESEVSNEEENLEILPQTIVDCLKSEENIEIIIASIDFHIDFYNIDPIYWAKWSKDILALRPHAEIAAYLSKKLYLNGYRELALDILTNNESYWGQKLPYYIEFYELKEEILSHDKNENFHFQNKSNEELNVVFNIYGEMHNVFLCEKDENSQIDDIENHYENSVSNFFKIDSDNIITCEINNEEIFKGTVSELMIGAEEKISTCDIETEFKEALAEFYFKKINTLHEYQDIDYKDIFSDVEISEKTGLIIINKNPIESQKMEEIAPDFENRYTMVEYGKFHLRTFPLKLTSLKLNDFFFVKYNCLEDMMGASAEGVHYSFSRIIHCEKDELEIEIMANNVKSTDFYSGWTSDY